MPRYRFGVPTTLIVSLAFGTVLNPLNSSMIAVALISLERHFEVGVATASWLVSGFYLAAAVGQPLMGRFADLFGARRLFVGGLVLVAIASILAPFVPGFWWLVGIRVIQAIGTSAAFPSALVLLRQADGPDATRPPASAMAALTVAASTSAALGPVIGGFLVAFAGWQAVFLVNIPLTITGVILGLRFLPKEQQYARPAAKITVDFPGIALFTCGLGSLLVFLLYLDDQPRWWLLIAFAVLAVLLVLRERSVDEPFLDVRGLAANPALTSVLLQQGLTNLIFYCVFFGLPMWLESVRGFGANQVGLLVLPIAAMGVLTVPLAARVVRSRSSRTALVFGTAVVLAATLLVQFIDSSTPIVLLVGIALLLGIPNGFNNFGLQTALYEASPPNRTGSSGGLFQTFRYLGAIMSTSVLGIVFEQDLSDRGLHHVGWVMTVLAVLLLTMAILLRRARQPE
ncbi:MFS transporter [Tenggerimyces flavus]|uniref:MFS transporter n=1 Tax=Tenggerimyces flavus TaxID=1708749 RepID=A0ABV7YD25_9ACTN|nr:MFS transporter [Tenggerimyces flavus]MBM7788096.1 MFS family permease [Tenggerimyces flavus]